MGFTPPELDESDQSYDGTFKALTGACSPEEARIIAAAGGKTLPEMFADWSAEMGFAGLDFSLLFPSAEKPPDKVESQ